METTKKAVAPKKTKVSGNSRKIGRSAIKKAGKGKALSLYVRDKITFEQYAKLAGIKSK